MARGRSAVSRRESIFYYQEIWYQIVAIHATSVDVRTIMYEVLSNALYYPPKHSIKKFHI